jgi:hypothetical protein
MKKFGTREEVINNLSKQTRGGLTKRFLKYNAEGKIISVRRRKQRGGVGDIQKILKYIKQPNTYYFTGSDIPYSRYLQMIMVAKEHSESAPAALITYDRVWYIFIKKDDGQIYKFTDSDYKRFQQNSLYNQDLPENLVFLTNILICDNKDDPVIESISDLNCEQIDITIPNATFYTKTPYECGDPSRVIAKMSIISDYKKDITEENNLTVDNVESTTKLTERTRDVIKEYLTTSGNIPENEADGLVSKNFYGLQVEFLTEIYTKSKSNNGSSEVKTRYPNKQSALDIIYKSVYAYVIQINGGTQLLNYKGFKTGPADNVLKECLDIHIAALNTRPNIEQYAYLAAPDGNCGFHSIIYPMIRHWAIRGNIPGGIQLLIDRCADLDKDKTANTFPEAFRYAEGNPIVFILNQLLTEYNKTSHSPTRAVNEDHLSDILRTIINSNEIHRPYTNHIEMECVNFLRKYIARCYFTRTGYTIDTFSEAFEYDPSAPNKPNAPNKPSGNVPMISILDVWEYEFLNMGRSINPEFLKEISNYFGVKHGVIHLYETKDKITLYDPTKHTSSTSNNIVDAIADDYKIFMLFSGGHYDMFYVE